MARNSVADWSATASDNKEIGGISIDEGCDPGNLNDAIRALMVQIRAFFTSALFRIRDATDQSKLLAFDISGFSAGTTRTVTWPNGDGTVMFTNSQLANAQALPGQSVQSITANQSAYYGSGSTIPVDDTIPTATEGDSILSVAIIPRSATNKLRFRAVVPCTRGNAGNALATLSLGGAAVAVGITSVNFPGEQRVIVLDYEMVAGATTQITASVRIGPGDSGVMYINGNQAQRFFGGTLRCTLTADEIKA